MLHDLVSQAWISCLQVLRMQRSMPTATPVFVGGYMMIQVWYHVSSLVIPLPIPWNQTGKHRFCMKAASAIISNYITLVQVNPRYISLFIMPIIMLVFIGALFIKASPKSSLKCNQDKNSDEVYTTGSSEISSHQLEQESNGNGSIRGADISLFLTAALPGWILCWIEADSGLVVSQFFLFLSSSMGELSMMLANLPSQVAPAFEVIHRASLVVMLLTAHTMAVEALGDDAVLVCLPELVAALVLVTIYLGHGGSSTVRTVDAMLRKADILAGAVVVVILACVAYICEKLKVESDGEMNLLSSYMYLLVLCSFSVILPFLCLFALRQCLGQTKAGASSELAGAVRLLSFLVDILFLAEVVCFVVYPIALFAPLRLQLEGLVKDKWRDFLIAANDVISKFTACLS